MSAAGTRSTTRPSATLGACGSSRMPTPRTSIRPAMLGGALARTAAPSRRSSVWSSATRRAPRSMRRSARSDLPLPGGPRSKTPTPPISTQVPWVKTIRASGYGRVRQCQSQRDGRLGSADRAPGAQRGGGGDARNKRWRGGAGPSSRGEADDEARPDDLAVVVAAVLGTDPPAMRLDDLPRDGEAEAGMHAELLADRALA